LIVVAQQFSSRYESRGDLVVIDVRGLDRLFGGPRAIGEELRRDAADRGLRAHVAVAGTQTVAMILAISRPGVVVIEPGGEAAAIAGVSLDVFRRAALSGPRPDDADRDPEVALQMFSRWGLKTLGDIAALRADELSSRIGQPGLVWHAMACGRDVRPLVPDVEDERFESSLDLDWPIEGLEPLSFVLTRLLEPLSLRLEQRDRGVAVLHVQLRLVTADKEKTTHARRLELPTPMRDVRTLRTLALLDLEAHPPGSAIDRVAIVIDPTPGRVWQHTLFARPRPTPEQLSTLLARLGAAMGQDRIGAPVTVDSYRPGAFTMKPFAVEHDPRGRTGRMGGTAHPACPAFAVRRCRQPVPARVVTADNRPVKVTSDRRGFAGGSVLRATGPWKTSGEWWTAGWDRDEWDVALSDGGAYRVFLDRATSRWFIDAIID
jgi:protein ImuB